MSSDKFSEYGLGELSTMPRGALSVRSANDFASTKLSFKFKARVPRLSWMAMGAGPSIIARDVKTEKEYRSFIPPKVDFGPSRGDADAKVGREDPVVTLNSEFSRTLDELSLPQKSAVYDFSIYCGKYSKAVRLSIIVEDEIVTKP